MVNFGSAFYDLKGKLQNLYDERESAAIAHEVLNHITGLNKTQRLINKDTLFTEAQYREYELATSNLSKGVPLQYVLGKAWFMDWEFTVNNNVLIPRPETEELVQWVLDDHKNDTEINILDIGTGSGCIPISLKLKLPQANVSSCDISEGALVVAKSNADLLGAIVEFTELDFLNEAARNNLPVYDVIVSNPPYIPKSEAEQMHTNVKDHEPNIALFVPDEDALVFYRAIAWFGLEHLSNKGYIYCELALSKAIECKQLFIDSGYKDVELRQDMHGNWRMLKAGK